MDQSVYLGLLEMREQKVQDEHSRDALGSQDQPQFCSQYWSASHQIYNAWRWLSVDLQVVLRQNLFPRICDTSLTHHPTLLWRFLSETRRWQSTVLGHNVTPSKTYPGQAHHACGLLWPSQEEEWLQSGGWSTQKCLSDSSGRNGKSHGKGTLG